MTKYVEGAFISTMAMEKNKYKYVRWIGAGLVVLLFILIILRQRRASIETARLIRMVEKTRKEHSVIHHRNMGEPGRMSPGLSPVEREELVRLNPLKIQDDRPPARTARAIQRPPTPAVQTAEKQVINLRLLGTIVTGDGGWAFIADPTRKSENFYETGSRVGDVGILIKVERSAAVLEVDGRQERLEIDWLPANRRDGAGRPPKAGAGLFRKHTRVGVNFGPPARNSSNITVNKADLESNIRNLGSFLSQMRIQPFFEKGRRAGFLISSVKRGSFVQRLGVRSGDIIRSVNGERITSIQKAFRLFNAFKNSSSVQLGVTRNGRPHQLNFRIQ